MTAPADTAAKAQAAYNQASRYAAGALAGIELATYRYLVLVSSKAIELPADSQVDGITYRHVNIAADPDVPSRG